MILLSGFAFYSLILNNIDSYNKSASEVNASELNRNREELTISSVQITSENKLILTVKNTGSVSSRLLWLGLFNQSVTPEWQQFFPLSEQIEPAETTNITSNDFTITKDQKYVVQITTEAGNIFSSTFYPASEVNCALTLVAASPSIYQGNNITLFLTVTHNDPEVDIIQNITVSLQTTPSGLVTVKEQPSSLTIESLRTGETAFFKWIYQAINTGTVTFNATYNQATAGTFALSTVTIATTPAGGAQGQVTITGQNGSATFNPSQWTTLGGTQNVSGTIANLTSSDSNPVVFRSYYTGTGTGINDYVDINTSNVDGSPSKGTHSNFAAHQVGPDAIYDTLTETGSTSTNTYNPSSYSLLGSTQLVSGTLTDLQTDNGAYMTFRSYVSASSASSKTDAFIAYRSNTLSGLSFPKNRLWDGDTTVWGVENEMATANSPVRWVRTAVSPINERSLEKIAVTLSDDGYLDAYVFDGTAWTATNNIAFPGTTANAYKCFDVAYEKTSGRAVLVYSRGTTTNEIGFRIWTFDSGWGSEQLLDLPYTTGIVYWISLATAPGTRAGTADDNEIAMIYLDANVDVHGYVWTGSAWSLMGATAVWDATAAIATEECIAVAYEQVSGRAMFVWGDSVATDNYNRIWDGTTLSGPTLSPDIAAQGAVTNWITLKSNPSSNEIMFLVIDGASDLNTAYWSGSAWTVHTEHDGTVSTNAQRSADFAWEPTGGKGLLVWGTTAGQIAYRTFTAPNTWGTQQNPAMGSLVHPWVQLRTNPRSISGDTMILGAVMEGGTALDIGAIKWDGTAFTVIGTTTISSDTTVITYECFELEFQQFGDPTEFTSEVEFTGTSNTESWTQLTWTIDSSFTTSGVTSTFQLYNYAADAYSTSGDGYMTDTIGTTDTTKTQTITLNPTQFKDASGNWRLKITGVKTTASQFNWQGDLVAYAPSLVNYELDLEVQWSSADFSQTNEWLCIYGGTMAAENIRVDVWTGVTWQNVFTNLSSGWNNVSISTYLTSSTFTIRFKGGTETSDTVQSSWGIDVSLLQLWTMTDQNTAEVEFTGSPNVQNWISFTWSIYSAWNASQVSVTIQFYNFTVGAYVTSGEGYLTYTSSATPNTYELKSQTVTADIEDFTNSTGHWQAKITGVKDTASQFNMSVDLIEADASYLSNGENIPYSAWQWYTIKATSAGGEPIPYSYISIYANGTNLTLYNALTNANITNTYPIQNPNAWVQLDASGEYQLYLKSTSSSSETFMLYASVGATLGQKKITQEP